MYAPVSVRKRRVLNTMMRSSGLLFASQGKGQRPHWFLMS